MLDKLNPWLLMAAALTLENEGAAAAGAEGGEGAKPVAGVKGVEGAKPAEGVEDGEGAKPSEGTEGDDWRDRRMGEMAARNRNMKQTLEDTQRANELLLEEVRALKNKPPEGAEPPKPAAHPDTAGLKPGSPEFQAAVQAHAAAVEFNRRADAVFDAGTSKYPDFDKAVKITLNDGLGANENAAFYPAILDMDAPTEILYHLGKNPAKAERLLKMTPTQMIKELAKLEIEITKTPPKGVSAAPKPPTPVDGTTDKNMTELRADQSIDDWMAARQRQIDAKRASGRRVF